MFPTGFPGLALLLLRASVAFALVLETYLLRQDLPGWIQLTAMLFAAALSAGYLTPIFAILGLALHVVVWFKLGVVNFAEAIIVSVNALALTLLGPGSYSVDSHLFGRRVVLPPR